MALKKCKECGKEVSTKAEACPHCGAQLKRKGASLGSGCLALLVVLIAAGWLIAKFDTPDVAPVKKMTASERQNKIKQLEAQVKPMPAYKTEENLQIYKQLASLDPGNELYKQKVAYYKQQRDRDLAEYNRRTAKYGPRPENSAWDGSVDCVKQYLKAVAKDPDSIKYSSWGEVKYDEQNGWVVWCDWRSKNSFGGYVRSVNWFIIQQGRVVEMKEANTYY